MAYIPDKGILWAVEYTMHGNCKLNNTKVRGKMATVFSYDIYDCFTDFLGKLLEFFLRKLFDVFRRMNL